MKDHRRYFIELQPQSGPTPPRWQEAEIRRQQATHFIAEIGEWLKHKALLDKVAMAVTALGQVQIICEAEILSQIRSAKETDIAAIRPGASLAEILAG